jgi:hypothetical protein
MYLNIHYSDFYGVLIWGRVFNHHRKGGWDAGKVIDIYIKALSGFL